RHSSAQRGDMVAQELRLVCHARGLLRDELSAARAVVVSWLPEGVWLAAERWRIGVLRSPAELKSEYQGIRAEDSGRMFGCAEVHEGECAAERARIQGAGSGAQTTGVEHQRAGGIGRDEGRADIGFVVLGLRDDFAAAKIVDLVRRGTGGI